MKKYIEQGRHKNKNMVQRIKNFIDIRGKKRHYIRVEVLFGNPKKHCTGSGICKIITNFNSQGTEKNKRHCTKGRGLASWNTKGELIISIFKGSMCTHLKKRYFSKQNFEVIEPIATEFEILHKEERQNVIIVPGRYLIIESQSSYDIFFGECLFLARGE